MGMSGASNCVIKCGKGVTKQSFKDDCDINKVLDKYQKTGVIRNINPRTPKFGDFTKIPDYRTACDLVIKAQAEFMALPAVVRARFRNEPAELIEFLSDPSNSEEAIKLGLKEPKKPEDIKTPALEPPGGPVAPKA